MQNRSTAKRIAVATLVAGTLDILAAIGLTLGFGRKVDAMLYDLVSKYDGAVSAEHGVGLAKKPFLTYSRAPAEIEIMKKIKAAFDPDNIINPGKIF